MEDNVGSFYLYNGEVRQSPIPLTIDMSSGKTAYEVLRIIRGVPLFYEDHFGRMNTTLQSIGGQLLISLEQLRNVIKRLLAANGLKMCNVKLVVYDADNRQNLLAYISKSYYPTEAESDGGTKTGLLRLLRNNPNAKILNQNYKENVARRMKEGNFFEVLLVDDQGRITEGSRSNVFFISNGSVMTAPGESVLKGITRQYVFEACRMAGYEVKEEFVRVEELAGVEGAFLSGTSIKVFPIATIDELRLEPRSNAVVQAIRMEYDKLLNKYVDENGNYW